MRFIPRASADRLPMGAHTAYEYDFIDPDINLAKIALAGRYPTSGRTTNTVSKMCCYVLHGSGSLYIEDDLFELEEGDAIIIEANERYYWDADMTLLIASTPPWTKEQAQATE